MRTLAYLALGGLILAVAGTAGAVSYTLSDLNSTATLDTSTGMTSWTVDNQSQLFVQAFYFGIGNGAVANLGSLPLTYSNAFDTNDNPGLDFLSEKYDGNGLEATIAYSLAGGATGSLQSDMGEQITVKNTSEAAISLHFYEYVDLDLGGTPNDDTVNIVNGRVADQSDPFFTMAEVVVTPPPSLYQAGNNVDVLDSVLGGTLTDNPGSYTGNAAWAFEWDVTLNPGAALLISKDKEIGPVPEPMTMLGVLSGIGGVGAYIRKRKMAA